MRAVTFGKGTRAATRRAALLLAASLLAACVGKTQVPLAAHPA